MIKSMTGFAAAENTGAGVAVTIEIRAVNSRGLDIVARLPQAYQILEERIKNCVKTAVNRGRMELFIKIREEADAEVTYTVNEGRAKGFYSAVTSLAGMFGLDGGSLFAQYLSSERLIERQDAEPDLEERWPVVEAALQSALTDLDTMKRTEGAYIEGDIVERLAVIENGVSVIEEASSGLSAAYQERLKERIQALTRGIVEVDPARIAQEAAFLADKSDISEEITRAKSHIEQFRAILADEAPGRKLNFLLQEFNREFNTMGSKTTLSDVSHTVVNLKTEIEKIREQIQNVE